MGIINRQNTNQTPRRGGCLRKIIIIAVVIFVAYYLLKSCGGGLLNLGSGSSSDNSATTNTTNTNTTTTTTTNNSNTNTSTTTNYGDYSWIVGTWSCEMGVYGTVIMKFEGDGTSGKCAERQSDGSYRYGTYQVNNDVLSFKLSGESIPKKISIKPGQKLLDESGSYYRKK